MDKRPPFARIIENYRWREGGRDGGIFFQRKSRRRAIQKKEISHGENDGVRKSYDKFGEAAAEIEAAVVL